MAPAFAHPWQKWLFFSFIALICALPFLPKPDWMDRSALYLGVTGKRGNFEYFANHVLHENADIDILFLGPSVLEATINPIIVKDVMRPILKREPVVYVVGHGRFGVDLDYLQFLDILRKRKVKLLVWYRRMNEVYRVHNSSHSYSNYLWDFWLNWPEIRQLDFNQILSSYFFSIMTDLRLVLSPFKDRLPFQVTDETVCFNIADHFGACPRWLEKEGLDHTMPPIPALTAKNLIHYLPSDTRPGIDAAIIPATQDSDFERIFISGVFRVAKQYGAEVAFLNIPTHITISPNSKIPVPYIAQTELGKDAPIIGTPVKALFPGLDRTHIASDFYIEDGVTSQHPHYGMANFYTRAIMPAIVELYKRAAVQSFPGEP